MKLIANLQESLVQTVAPVLLLVPICDANFCDCNPKPNALMHAMQARQVV